MKPYQLTYLISQDHSEEEVKEITEEITSLIQKEKGATIVDSTSPIKKTSAYPIKDQRRVYLMNINFYFNPQKIKDLKQKIKTNNKILRFILSIKKPEKKRVGVSSKTSFKERITQATSVESAKKKDREKEKGKLDEIEKKLDEILGQ